MAQLIADAAPVDATLTTPVETTGGDLAAATAAGAQVVVPADASGQVALTGGLTNGQSVRVALDLPEEVDAGAAVIARDGTVVYPSEDSTDVAVQTTDEGVRVHTILRDPSAPTEYTYALEGVLPELNADGSVSLTIAAEDEGEGAILVVGAIAAPWAVDANGNVVPTRYRVDGATLVQEVDHLAGNYTYPIVADPSVSLGRYIYVRYSKAEVQRIAPYAWTSRFQALFCLAIPNIVAAGACAIALDQWTTSIANTVVSAARSNRCVEVRYTLIGAAPVGWNSYAC